MVPWYLAVIMASGFHTKLPGGAGWQGRVVCREQELQLFWVKIAVNPGMQIPSALLPPLKEGRQ